MGFWTWLTGKNSSVTATDRIWLTQAARRCGLCRELSEHLTSAQPVLLLAHFPATLTEVQQELSRQGVPHRSVDHAISAKEVSRWADPGAERLVHLGLVKQLQPDPFPDQRRPSLRCFEQRLGVVNPAKREGSIHILVAERHFLRDCDDAVITFAEGLAAEGLIAEGLVAEDAGKRCHVMYHCSLEDPLMKVFAGAWVKQTLQRLGMEESAPLESPMIARQVRAAQRKFAARAGRWFDADSAEAWLQSNGFGESR
jgi:hypothetical protein